MINANIKLDYRSPPRRGFTLIELLVVIAIIIVLVSLVMVALPKVLDPANEAVTRTDITQLSAALQAFETKFQVSYVPSRIILCKNLANYFVPNTFNSATGQGTPLTGLHQDSIDYLTRLFPRITTPGGVWVTTGINWNGDGQMLDPLMGPNGIAVNGANPTPFVGFALEGE